ncbi:MAG: hypothetical protein QM778_01645 [Myxococcales bacterium]
MLRSALLALLLCCLAVPAQAWTRAHVREVDVAIAHQDASAWVVDLTLGVEVGGGWLERLELPGLAGLPAETEQVDAWWETEAGDEVRPEVRVREAQLELRFTRASAPRRGVHRLRVRYTLAAGAGALMPEAPSYEAEGAQTLAWTLPGWESGLTHAKVRWLVPKGTHATRDAASAQQISERAVEGNRREISFERVHVPRESPWRVAVVIPGATLGDSPSMTKQSVRDPLADLRARWPFGLATLGVGLLSWAGRRRARAWAAREGAAAEAWWSRPLGRALGSRANLHVGAAQLLLAGLTVVLGEQALGPALVCVVVMTLLAVESVVPAPAARSEGHFGHFEAISGRALADARRGRWRERFGPGAVLDAGSVFGGLALGACAVAAWFGAQTSIHGQRAAWALVMACGVIPLLAGARVRLPRSLNERVVSLAVEAAKLELMGVGLRLIWRKTSEDRRSEPRLRVVPARPHQGLLRIDVMADSRPSNPSLVLCVVVLSDSSAARALANAWSGAANVQSGAGKRTAYVVPCADLARDLEGLLGVLAEYERRAVESLATDRAREAA